MLPSPLSLRELGGGGGNGAATSLAASLAGSVVNVNVPRGEAAELRGYRLAWQGQHCHFPNFEELEADPHVAQGHAGKVSLRAFKNAAGSLRGDESEGCDSWVVQQGWVAVTPVGLRSDVPLTPGAALQRAQPRLTRALVAAVQAAAEHLGVEAAGIPEEAAAAAADGPAAVVEAAAGALA